MSFPSISPFHFEFFSFSTSCSSEHSAARVFLLPLSPATILTLQQSNFSRQESSILLAEPFTGSAGISTLRVSGRLDMREAENLPLPAEALTENTVAIPVAPLQDSRLVPAHIAGLFSKFPCPAAQKGKAEMSVKSL
jgi:hypothetical protein